MSDNRISKLIMQWDKQLAEHGNFATWYSEVKSILDENNVTNTVTPSENTSGYINTLKKELWMYQTKKLENDCQAKPSFSPYGHF